MSATATAEAGRAPFDAARVVRAVLPLTMAALVLGFAAASPTFRSGANVVHVLLNDVTLPALPALGLTFVVATGGIDLSIGTAADLASLVAALTVSDGGGGALALVLGVAAAIAVGLFNALLVAGLGIAPFLATLGTLFIGESVQQLATGGGAPIYIVSGMPRLLDRLAHGALAGVPTPILSLAVAAAATAVLLDRSGYGRRALVTGIAPAVARCSGVPVARVLFGTFVLSALFAGAAGLLLLGTVRSYVPLAGNAFLLNAIGAVFLGTTIDRLGRPNVVGTLLGVLLFGVLRNGLLLVGWNPFSQQVAIGLLVLGVLALSFGARRVRAA